MQSPLNKNNALPSTESESEKREKRWNEIKNEVERNPYIKNAVIDASIRYKVGKKPHFHFFRFEKNGSDQTEATLIAKEGDDTITEHRKKFKVKNGDDAEKEILKCNTLKPGTLNIAVNCEAPMKPRFNFTYLSNGVKKTIAFHENILENEKNGPNVALLEFDDFADGRNTVRPDFQDKMFITLSYMALLCAQDTKTADAFFNLIKDYKKNYVKPDFKRHDVETIKHFAMHVRNLIQQDSDIIKAFPDGKDDLLIKIIALDVKLEEVSIAKRQAGPSFLPSFTNSRRLSQEEELFGTAKAQKEFIETFEKELGKNKLTPKQLEQLKTGLEGVKNGTRNLNDVFKDNENARLLTEKGCGKEVATECLTILNKTQTKSNGIKDLFNCFFCR